MIRHSELLAVIAFLCLFPVMSGAEGTRAPVTLDEGLKQATEEGRLVRIAAYNTAIADQDIAIARARYYPTVDASAGYTLLAYQPGVKIAGRTERTSDRNYASFGVTARETIYDFGARSSSYGIAEEGREIARADLVRIRNLVALDFINAYYSLLEAGKLVAVARREVEAVESHRNMAGSLFDAGVITKNDLLQAEVRLSDAKQRLVTAGNLKELNASRLNTILSRPLDEEVAVTETDTKEPPALDLAEAWGMAEAKRQELRIIDREIAMTGLQEQAKRAEYFPTLFAEGGYNYTENSFQVHEDNWSLLLGLKINLFSGGSTRAEIAKTGIRADQLREERRKIVEDLRLEVRRYHLDELNARENTLTAQGAVSQAEENLRINNLRYREGVGTATDVLDAIALLTLAEKNYCKALYDLRRARAGLLHAAGQDLTERYQ